jgi:hypothetical protein
MLELSNEFGLMLQFFSENLLQTNSLLDDGSVLIEIFQFFDFIFASINLNYLAIGGDISKLIDKSKFNFLNSVKLGLVFVFNHNFDFSFLSWF